MQRIISKREKIIFYATLGVLVFSLCFNFLLSPVLKRNEQLNDEINLSRVKLKKYLWLLKQKDYIYNKNKGFIYGYDTALAGKDPLVSSLSELESLTKNANIRIIDLRPQNTRNLNAYKEIIIDLRTEGAMESYLKFIYDLEHSLSLLRIKKLELNVKPNSQILEGKFSISQLSAGE